jgi:hypothetical protein
MLYKTFLKRIRKIRIQHPGEPNVDSCGSGFEILLPEVFMGPAKYKLLFAVL